MKVEFIEVYFGTSDHSYSEWRWHFGGAVSQVRYSRRSSAKRGFRRFLARVRHISGKGKKCS